MSPVLSVASAPIDPNWLLSTTAQSGAALVAIVGGLLVSRVVSLHSEREGLLRRLRETEARRPGLQSRLSLVHGERLAQSTEWFVDHHLEDMVARRGDLNIDDILDDWLPRGSSAEEMRPVAEAMAKSVSRAIVAIEAALRGARLAAVDAASLRDEGVDVPTEEEALYVAVAKALGVASNRGYGFPVLPTATSPIVYQRQDRRIEAEQALVAEIRALDAETDVVGREVRLLGRATTVIPGLAVLTYFAAAGVVFPLMLMAIHPVPETLKIRIVVVGLFASGLIALLAYLVWSVARLRSNEPMSANPDNQEATDGYP